ncbi:MAG TPA: NAD(P)/FAD-dependent oxidoreductase [Hyphomicrobiaceae bacterium]|nr:NAD(P)/FAD-dependent oxidoreductase [Hyphomicrobiaceae bacterium]
MTEVAIGDAYDVVVIGAGPAGLASAALAAEAGASTLLVDENAGPGGQVYRAITSTPVEPRDALGSDYWLGSDLVERAQRSGARLLLGAVVWTLDPDLVVGISYRGRAQLIQARRVIIATGALERPFPIPGWTLPGVMTVGAAQTVLKASGLAPASATVIAGMGPLIWLYAAQVLRLGGRIDAILDTTPMSNYIGALRHAPGFLLSPLRAKGLSLVREVKRRVRVVKNVTALRAEGDTVLRRVVYMSGGREQSVDAATLLLHQGVVPNVNLAMAAGVKHAWDPVQLCWSPELDADGGTSVPGIAVAGDGAGIAGAFVAEERGRLAARAAIRAILPHAPLEDDQSIRNRLTRHQLGRKFIDTLFQPPRQFRIPEGETIVCRCEEVTADQIRATAALGCEGPNQMKAFLRCGMGPCQGRLCGLTVTEIIADVHGKAPADIGYYRLRPPVKPISLAELAGVQADEAATKAVVRL